MNPFELQIVRVADPLSAHCRSVRKSLLLASVVVIAVAQAGFFPTKITALGLEFSQADRLSLLWLLGVVLAYFLVSFFILAASDFAAWRLSQLAKLWEEETTGNERSRKALIEGKNLTTQEKETLAGYDRTLGTMWRNAGHVSGYERAEALLRPISISRMVIEFVVPAVAGMVALAFLIRATP